MIRANGTDRRVNQMRCEISTGVESPGEDIEISEIRRYRPEAKIGAKEEPSYSPRTVSTFSELSQIDHSQLKSRIVQVSFGLLALILVNGS